MEVEFDDLDGVGDEIGQHVAHCLRKDHGG